MSKLLLKLAMLVSMTHLLLLFLAFGDSSNCNYATFNGLTYAVDECNFVVFPNTNLTKRWSNYSFSNKFECVSIPQGSGENITHPVVKFYQSSDCTGEVNSKYYASYPYDCSYKESDFQTCDTTIWSVKHYINTSDCDSGEDEENVSADYINILPNWNNQCVEADFTGDYYALLSINSNGYNATVYYQSNDCSNQSAILGSNHFENGCYTNNLTTAYSYSFQFTDYSDTGATGGTGVPAIPSTIESTVSTTDTSGMGSDSDEAECIKWFFSIEICIVLSVFFAVY